MENYIVIKAFPGVKVGTVLTWCNESDAFKSSNKVFEPSEVINNKEFFTIATDLVYVVTLTTYMNDTHTVMNIYVGSDCDVAEVSTLDKLRKGFCGFYTIEIWMNGNKISEKEID